MYIFFEDLNERIWERVRNDTTQLPLRTAFRYWLLDCKIPW